MPVDVPFWTWINETTVALVTETSVFHWSINGELSCAECLVILSLLKWARCTGDTPPQKIFDRADNLVGTQIISYKTDANIKWCQLTGIAGRVSRHVALVNNSTN